MTASSLDVNDAIGSATQALATSESSACESVGSKPKPVRDPHAGHHKDLHKLSVMDCENLQEIIPNTGPIFLDNDCFSGHIQLLIRTPDVDCKHEEMPTLETARRTSRYMKNFKRRFEFQFQIKLSELTVSVVMCSVRSTMHQCLEVLSVASYV